MRILPWFLRGAVGARDGRGKKEEGRGKGVRAPLVRRPRRRVLADGPTRTNVVAGVVGAAPVGRLERPWHVARAYAVDVVEREVEPEVEIVLDDALRRGDRACTVSCGGRGGDMGCNTITTAH